MRLAKTPVQPCEGADIAMLSTLHGNSGATGSSFFRAVPFHPKESLFLPYLRQRTFATATSCRKAATALHSAMEKEGLDFYWAVEFLGP